MLKTRRFFGPRISLTARQEAAIIARCEAAGLQCLVENCHTGSAYVAICLPKWEQDINDQWFVDCGEEVAKIRLSGHDEGKRQDSTHVVIGGKSVCLTRLNEWVAEVIAEQGAAAVDILAANKPE